MDALLADPMAALFQDSDALARTASPLQPAPAIDQGSAPPNSKPRSLWEAWDPSPPVPTNGKKGPQWGSKIRVSTRGFDDEASSGGGKGGGARNGPGAGRSVAKPKGRSVVKAYGGGAGVAQEVADAREARRRGGGAAISLGDARVLMGIPPANSG